jgi:DNA-binding PucR family transcriptional regulator
VATGSWPGADGPVRAQLSALRSLLTLSMLLTQQDNQASILHFAANAVGSLGPCRTEGIVLDGQWQDVQVAGRLARPAGLPELPAGRTADGGVPAGIPGAAWSWAYSLSSRRGLSGHLVVGCDHRPTTSERFLVQVLAQQTGVALANAHLHSQQRAQAAELQAANLALQRSMEIHNRLTGVALQGQGHEGIAEAVCQLTRRATAIEDRFGNLQAWAGPGRPDPYPKDSPDRRDRLLSRLMAATGPVRDGARVYSLAQLGGVAVGMIILHDPDGSAGDAERVAMEHATTVLCMHAARLQSLAEADRRLRANLVFDLIGGTGLEEAAILNRAQSLGYDLGRPHHVVLVDGHGPETAIDVLFQAVTRAAREVGVGSLLAPRLHDVIILADTDASLEQFRKSVVAELNGGRCRIGVGGSCRSLADFTRSYREAELALQMQETSGGPAQVTQFTDLGVFQVLATTSDTSAMERYAARWLGALADYDAANGAHLVRTLSEYLACGGNYDASARALSVHRSTLKYRLRRIREVSGYDLGDAETQFNLQLATRTWRTLQVLRQG